jgi:hypothetical protein
LRFKYGGGLLVPSKYSRSDDFCEVFLNELETPPLPALPLDKDNQRPQGERFAFLWHPAVLVTLINFMIIGYFVMVRHYTALDFVHLGTIWGQHNPWGTWGYDGQFYYQIARNPFGAAQYMDSAPYRYQHFLYGLVAWVLSFGGQVALVPYALLLINLLAIGGSVELVARLLSKNDLLPWFSLGLGLFFGLTVGLLFDTTEPFTVFLLCLGLYYLERKQMLVSALWLGLATISRETAVLFPLSLACWLFWKQQWRATVLILVLGVLPLLLFLLGLAVIFGKTGVTFTPPFEHVPFAGIFYYRSAPHKFWLLVVLSLVPLVGSLAFLAWDVVRLRVNEYMLLWAANLGLMIFLSHFSYIELISAGRPASLAVLAAMFYAMKTRNRTLLWALQFSLVTLLIYLIGVYLHLDSFIA